MNVGNVGTANNLAQEALETAAQTRAEAAKGDQQAVRKEARAEAANVAQSPQSTERMKRGLDVTA